MRGALVAGLLLSVVAVALVAVCEHSEICRLRYRVFESERRRDSLERQLRELDAALAATATPRRLLEEDDARRALGGTPSPHSLDREGTPPPTPVVVEVDGRRFVLHEGGGR